MKHLKHQIPTHTLRTIYNALIIPHINYGILAWGQNLKQITKLQKKAVRTVTLSKYNAHTKPLFKQQSLLKIEDIMSLNELKFYYNLVHQNLPR